jgi:trigger factor
MTEIQLQELGPCKRKLSVKIPPDRVSTALRNGWQSAQRSIQLKGFRPGKVPRSVLEKRYGDEIQKQIKEGLVNDAFREAVEKHSLKPVLAPRIDLTKLDLDPARELTFELDFEVTPDFDLKSYKGFAVEVPKVEVTDDLVDREIEVLRKRMAKAQNVSEGAVEKGDYIRSELKIQVDKSTVKVVENAVVDTNGDTIDGIPVEGGTAQFVGKKVGDSVGVPAKWPAGYEPVGFTGVECLLSCEVKEISRFTPPPLDEALVKQFGLDSVETFKARAREQVEHGVAQRRNQFIEERVLDQLIAATPFALPEETLAQMTKQSQHRVAGEMMKGGITQDEALKRSEQHLPKLKDQNERFLRVSFLVDRISTTEKIFVNDQDLEQAVRVLAAQQGREPQSLADEIVANNAVPQLRNQILEAKVRKFLRENATVTDIAPAEPAK